MDKSQKHTTGALQEFARNVELLRKSKDDVDVDMAERKAIQTTFNPDLDDSDEALDESVQINGAVDDDTLRLSYHLIRGRWIREDGSLARHGKFILQVQGPSI